MYQSTCIYFSTYVHFETCLSSISTEISIFCFYSVHFEAWFFFNKYRSFCLPFLFSTFWSLIFLQYVPKFLSSAFIQYILKLDFSSISTKVPVFHFYSVHFEAWFSSISTKVPVFCFHSVQFEDTLSPYISEFLSSA